MTELIDKPIEELSTEELTELLNQLQLRAQKTNDLSDEELRKAVEVLSRIRTITSAAAQKRIGKSSGPPPSLDDF